MSINNQLDFAKFKSLIRHKSGIVLDDQEKDNILIKLQARMRLNKIQDWENYFNLLHGDEGDVEFKSLMNLLTINETYFFRVREHFQIIQEKLFEYLAKKDTQKIKIWSAGCSSGEEAYTLAIVLSEMKNILWGWDIEIIGTDISENAILLANEGIYSQRALKEMEDYYIKKYFHEMDSVYKIDDSLKKMVTFRYQNLNEPLDPLVFQGLDIIFFRNVMIYLDINRIRAILKQMYNLLENDGMLFVAPAESLWKITTSYNIIFAKNTFYYKKNLDFDEEDDKNKIIKYSPVSSKPKPVVIKEEELLPANNTAELPETDNTPHFSDTALKDKYISREEELRQLNEEAKVFVSAGNIDKAIECYLAIILINKVDVNAYLELAGLYLKQEKPQEALDIINEGIEYNPLVPDFFCVKAKVYETMGQGEDAESEYIRSLYLDDKLIYSYIKLGDLYKTLGNKELSARNFKNALSLIKKDDWNDLKYIKPFENFSKDILINFLREKINNL